MIQNINILTRNGKSLIFRNYGSSDVDRNIIEAILDNAKDISQNEVKSTLTDEFKYFYTIIDEIIIIICSDLSDDTAVINSKINEIRAKFIEEYRELLTSGGWTGNRTIFTEFEREIDDVILEPIKVSIIGLGGTDKTDLVHLICGKDWKHKKFKNFQIIAYYLFCKCDKIDRF